MSARTLAFRLAWRREQRTLTQLPRFTAADHPLRVRAHLLAYYFLRDAMIAERAAMTASGAALQERIVAAALLDEINGGIASARAVLAQVARRGGRGFDRVDA